MEHTGWIVFGASLIILSVVLWLLSFPDPETYYDEGEFTQDESLD